MRQTTPKRSALLVIVVGGCATLGVVLYLLLYTHLMPAREAVPDREIVFSVEPGVLGFINSDGGGYVTRTIDLSGWSPLVPFSPVTSALDQFTWSRDGKYLAGRYSVVSSSSGIPFLISAQGELLRCPPNPSSPDGPGRSWVISETKLLTVNTSPNVRHDQVIMVDMKTCKTIDVLYTASGASSSENLIEAALSVSDWLAIGLSVKKGDIFAPEIMVIGSDGAQVATLPGGISPAWSPTGEWLAYSIVGDGLYIAKRDGSEIRKLLSLPDNRSRSVPSWSPDGAWLVYDKRVPVGTTYMSAIYKLNITNGQEQELFRGGQYPGWR